MFLDLMAASFASTRPLIVSQASSAARASTATTTASIMAAPVATTAVAMVRTLTRVHPYPMSPQLTIFCDTGGNNGGGYEQRQGGGMYHPLVSLPSISAAMGFLKVRKTDCCTSYRMGQWWRLPTELGWPEPGWIRRLKMQQLGDSEDQENFPSNLFLFLPDTVTDFLK